MARRLGWGIAFAIALGCSGNVERSESDMDAGGGSAHSAGASSIAGSRADDSPDDPSPGGAGGAADVQDVAGMPNAGGAGGAGGAASVHFWTESTQHIALECFGYFDGFATFRADRAQLSSEQLELLSTEKGVPGSTYDGNDDRIHCVVTTTDARGAERQFTINDPDYLIGIADVGGDAGAADGPVSSLLGCEFRHPFSNHEEDHAFSANPLCVREIWLESTTSGFGLKLATAGKPYHIELVNCTKQELGETTVVELFGADLNTPLAVGKTPDDPGPDQACLVLDAQVEAEVVGWLVFSTRTSFGPIHQLTFR